MSDRYFTQTPISSTKVLLDGHEAHHLVNVMRAKPGLEVTIFDGGGAEFVARVDRVARASVELTIVRREEINRELPFDLTLAVALPKGDRQKWLVEKAVELGVTKIVPLITTRGVVQPVERTVDRLRRTVIEASKQCGRNKLAEITEPKKWPNFVSQTLNVGCRIIAHPGCRSTSKGTGLEHPLSAIVPNERAAVGVGPEGGFTTQELAIAIESGWYQLDLGPRILRIETAAIFALAFVTSRLLQIPGD